MCSLPLFLGNAGSGCSILRSIRILGHASVARFPQYIFWSGAGGTACIVDHERGAKHACTTRIPIEAAAGQQILLLNKWQHTRQSSVGSERFSRTAISNWGRSLLAFCSHRRQICHSSTQSMAHAPSSSPSAESQSSAAAFLLSPI